MASKLRVDHIEPVGGIPTGGGGGIVQVKMTQTINSGSQFSTGSGSYVDITGYNCSITPTAASSKILVTLNPIVLMNNGSGSTQRCSVKLLRDSTSLLDQDDFFAYQVGSGEADYNGIPGYFQYLDSPSTTSAITYKVQIKQHAGGGTTYVQASSSIMLQEVSA